MAGRRARRRLHYSSAALTLLSLAASIVQAEHFGRDYSFPLLRLRVHLGFAFTALACIPWVAISGWRLRNRPHARTGHRRAVAAFVLLTASAIATALWMLLAATPIG